MLLLKTLMTHLGVILVKGLLICSTFVGSTFVGSTSFRNIFIKNQLMFEYCSVFSNWMHNEKVTLEKTPSASSKNHFLCSKVIFKTLSNA